MVKHKIIYCKFYLFSLMIPCVGLVHGRGILEQVEPYWNLWQEWREKMEKQLTDRTRLNLQIYHFNSQEIFTTHCNSIPSFIYPVDTYPVLTPSQASSLYLRHFEKTGHCLNCITQILKYINYNHLGKCSPEKECLRWHRLGTFR